MKRWCGFLLVLAGACALAGHSQRGEPSPPGDDVEDAAVAAQIDGRGDPLPAGAVARLGSVRVWRGEARAVAFAPDGKVLASGGDDGVVRLWDVTTGRVLRRLRSPRRPVLSLAFSPDGRALAAGGGSSGAREGSVFLWDVNTGKELRRFEGDAGEMHSFAFSPDGKSLVAATGRVWLWDVATGKERPLDRERLWREMGDNPAAVAFSPDGESFGLACLGKNAGLCRLRSGDLTKLPVEFGDWPSVAFSPDGKLLAVAGASDLCLWDTATGKQVRKLEGGSVSHFAFAADGKSIAWVDRGGAVHRTELATGKEATPLYGHSAGVNCLAYSPDGLLLASASADGTVLVWDATGAHGGPRARYDLSAREARSLAWEKTRDVPVPEGARVSLVLDKKEYFLGENVLAHFCVENAGQGVFYVETGGDYRGASRQLRFSVRATDADGKEVADPDPSGYCLGGISGSQRLKPGAKYWESLPLMRYCRFEKPGTYRLRVSHDLGWHADGPRKHPVAEATVTFVMPTAEQARKVIEETYRLTKDNIATSGEKQAHYADFTTLAYPVYLPLLAPRAAEGDERALVALEHMPTPEATAALLRLLNHKDAKVARRALQAIDLRLPDPLLEGKLPTRNAFDNNRVEQRRWLVSRSWRPEFAPPVRRVARGLLAGADTDTQGLECGAYVLECLGTAEDLPALTQALDRETVRARDLPPERGYPRPRGACQELQRAAHMMALRGARPSGPAHSSGETVLFVAKVGANKDYRPAGWEATYARALRHELPYVREVALNNLPVPPPEPLLKLVPALLADANVDVQIAACRVAEKVKAPVLRESVLRALASAREEWLLNAATNAACALGAGPDLIRVLVSRLDEEGMTAACLQHLTWAVLSDLSSHSCPTREMLGVAAGRACKAAWQKFLREHGAELQRGQRFSLTDPAMPLAELFPKFTFERPRR